MTTWLFVLLERITVRVRRKVQNFKNLTFHLIFCTRQWISIVKFFPKIPFSCIRITFLLPLSIHSIHPCPSSCCKSSGVLLLSNHSLAFYSFYFSFFSFYISSHQLGDYGLIKIKHKTKKSKKQKQTPNPNKPITSSY